MKRLLLLFVLVFAVWMVRAEVVPGLTYRIVPDSNPSKSLFVSNASFREHTPVVVWTETNVPAQQWTVVDLGRGGMAFRNVYTGKFLDATSGSLLQTGQQARWLLEAVDAENNLYRMKQKGYLRTTSTNDGSRPDLGGAQVWRFVEVKPQKAFDAAARQRMIDGFLQQYLQDRGNGFATFNNGEWGEAETLETMLDVYEVTGDRRALDAYERCYAYNQGTMLGAAVLLHRHYGDEQYRQDADRIVDFSRRELCDRQGVVKVCQNADGDFQGFKGILMRYVGLYARVYNNKVCQEWLLANAFHAYNNMNSRSFGHSAFLYGVKH